MNAHDTQRTTSRRGGALMLIVAAVAAAALLATVNRFTAPRIADNIAAEQLRSLRAVLTPGSFDNAPHRDVITVHDPELLGSDESLPIYRARSGIQPVAAVLTVVAPNGYAGRIRLLVAVGIDGEVKGVRVAEHRETPGLGDRIEARKSGWILGFRGLRTEEPTTDAWTLDRDGGAFDRLTGATITSRAVLGAVRNAVLYFSAHRAEIFPATTESVPLNGAPPSRADNMNPSASNQDSMLAIPSSPHSIAKIHRHPPQDPA